MNYNGYHTVEHVGCNGCVFDGGYFGECKIPENFPGHCGAAPCHIWVKDNTGITTVTLDIDTELLKKDLAEFFSTRDLSKYVKVSNQGS